MDSDNVLYLLKGITIGLIIGGLIAVFSMKSDNKKFCPTCGATYKKAVYCEYDGTLLKERGT